MPFSVEEAFAAFESPGQVIERQRAETSERLSDRARNQTADEAAASQAGSALAGAARALTGTESREVRAAQELQNAFQTITAASPAPESHDADIFPDGEAEQKLAAEQSRIELTGSQAEARFLEQGLSKDEAKLAAFDEVISGATIPEVARQLVFMKASAAADIAEKRKNIAVLKATGVDESIDRRLKEAQAQKAEADLTERGLELIKLQERRDDLREEGADEASPTMVEINKRIQKLLPADQDPTGEDKVLKRRFDTLIAEEGTKTLNALDQIVNIQAAFAKEPNANTTVSRVAGWVDGALQEAEVVFPGSRANLEKNLGLVDFTQFGRDAVAARQLTELMILSQTDAQIKGIPSNIDMAKIEQAVGRDLKNPEARAEIFRNLTRTTMSRFRNTAIVTNRLNHRVTGEVEARYKDKFIDGPARRAAEEAKAAEVKANAQTDFSNVSTADLLNELSEAP